MTMKLGFNIVNLIIPGEPNNFAIIGSSGNWDIYQHSNYVTNRNKLNSRVHAAVTYIADHEDNLRKDEDILAELSHLCLTLSYLTSNSVTTNQSTEYSRISFLQVGDAFPRARGITGVESVVENQTDLITSTNQIIKLFNLNKVKYHVDVIIQYWLDILSCWSLENLFLGACTILEIIKQCEIRRTGNANLHFYDAIVSVSTHLGIIILNRDWINMRNDLIHEGHLSKVRFPIKTKFECIKVCEDVMHWIDEFMHAIFSLEAIKYDRFYKGSLRHINSYTTWD